MDLLLIAVAAANPASAYLSASLATVGSVLGCLILFCLARKGGERFLYRHAKQGKAQTLTQWFQRYGLATVFVPALSPVPMPTKLFIICAGASGVRVAPFVLVVLAARIVRYFGLAYLGVAVWRRFRRLGEDPRLVHRRGRVGTIRGSGGSRQGGWPPVAAN